MDKEVYVLRIPAKAAHRWGWVGRRVIESGQSSIIYLTRKEFDKLPNKKCKGVFVSTCSMNELREIRK